VAAQELGVGDLMTAVCTLELDLQRDDETQLECRTKVQRHLAWLAKNDPGSLGVLGAEAVSLPPEAAGAIWEVGVARGSAALLATLEPLLASQPWAERVWVDVLIAAAPRMEGVMPISEHVAEQTRRSLDARIQALRERLAAPDPTGIVEDALHRADTAIVGALHHLSALAGQLVAIVDPTLEG
jgi:hypothetical protein